MSAARCPQCSAALLGSVDWCSQCYADLRPPAPPPPPPLVAAPPTVPSAATFAVTSAPAGPDPLLASLVTGPLDTPLARLTAEALADPLTAPIGYVDGAESAAAGLAAAVNDAPATAPTTVPRQEGWPCVRCGTVNDMELMECAACGYSFAADLATPIRVPGTRQSRIVITIGAVLTLLAMLALVIYLTTPEPAPKDEPTPRPITTQPIQPLPDPAP